VEAQLKQVKHFAPLVVQTWPTTTNANALLVAQKTPLATVIAPNVATFLACLQNPFA
jgi:hypothetical protein